jgi:CheY-like chemotaxis protein
MNIPDYVAPIVAYRAWRWTGSMLASLNGEIWIPRQPLEATCKLASATGGATTTYHHDAPQSDCRCGIYAARSLDQLRWIGYTRLGIYGEVYLWGVVVEHRLGWRAQFAYPKSFVLSSAHLRLSDSVVPQRETLSSFLFRTIRARRAVRTETAPYRGSLTAYGADIYVADGDEKPIPVWTNHSGNSLVGLGSPTKSGHSSYHIRVAILTEDQERQTILEKRVQDINIAQIVFAQVGLPTHMADAIVYQVQSRLPKVIIVDLTPRKPLPGIRAIERLRTTLGDVAIVAVGDTRSETNIMRALLAGADEYVDRNDRRGFDELFARILTRSQTRSRNWRGPRSGETPPGGPPPPPAIPVLSPRNWPRLPPSGATAWVV